MVGTASAIFSHCSTKLGRDHHDRVRPLLTQPGLKRAQTTVEPRQAQSQSALHGSLIGVGVPTVQGKHRCRGAVRCD